MGVPGVETLDGLGEDAWTKPGTVRFLQNDWAVSLSKSFGAVPDEALLEMAEMISARLPRPGLTSVLSPLLSTSRR